MVYVHTKGTVFERAAAERVEALLQVGAVSLAGQGARAVLEAYPFHKVINVLKDLLIKVK